MKVLTQKVKEHGNSSFLRSLPDLPEESGEKTTRATKAIRQSATRFVFRWNAFIPSGMKRSPSLGVHPPAFCSGTNADVSFMAGLLSAQPIPGFPARNENRGKLFGQKRPALFALFP